MCRLRCSSPSVITLLAFSLALSPPVSAEEIAAGTLTAPVAIAVSSTGIQSTAEQAPTLAKDWWKLPSTEASLNHKAVDSLRLSAVPAVQTASTQGSWSKTGKILTGIGLAALGAGAVMIAAGSSEDEVADSGVVIDWQLTGAIWAATGAVLTLVGLTRRD